MFGRVKDAMADAAETLRRAFAGLKVLEAAPEPFLPRCHGTGVLAAEPRAGLEPPCHGLREMRLLREAVEGRALEPFCAVIQAESGWARWGAEAEVVRMTPLEGGRAARVAVPPLPRKAQVLGRVEPPVPSAPAPPVGTPGAARHPAHGSRARPRRRGSGAGDDAVPGGAHPR